MFRDFIILTEILPFLCRYMKKKLWESRQVSWKMKKILSPDLTGDVFDVALHEICYSTLKMITDVNVTIC